MLVKDVFNHNPELAGLKTALTNLASLVVELQKRVSPHVSTFARFLQSQEVQLAMRNIGQIQADMQTPYRYFRYGDTVPAAVVEDLDARLPPLPHKRAGFTLPGVHDDDDDDEN